MSCPSCGGANDDDATFCFTCGMALAVLTQGAVLASRYEVERPLGRGGMGTVYRAFDRVLKEPVALKLLRPEIGQSSEGGRRFLSEIKLARQVSHKNVCRIHEYGEDQGMRFISMQLVEGTNLKQVIRDVGGLALEEAFDVSIQVARGLEAIHEVGIVHRDLKTPNIMRDAKGVVRVMDFGIAKKVGAKTTGGTVTGAVVGTPEYMSPEQAQGRDVDLRSDIYSLGVVIFEIFTGDVPFRGDTPLATLFKHVEAPPPLDEARARPIPASLVAVLRKALAKEPGHRFAHAGEMVKALMDARAEAAAGDAPPPPPRPLARDAPDRIAAPTSTMMARVTAPSPSRRARLWAVVVLGTVGVGLGAFTSLRQTEPTVPLRTPPVTPTEAPSESPAESGVATIATTVPASPSVRETRPVVDPRPAAARARVPPRDEPGPSPIAVEAARPAPAALEPTPPSPAPPTPLATPSAEPAAAPTSAPPLPPPPAASSPGVAAGVLQLLVVPFAEATVDGEPLGRVSSGKFSLSPGSHLVELTHPDYRPLRRTVRILPGETARLVVDLAEEAIRKRK